MNKYYVITPVALVLTFFLSSYFFKPNIQHAVELTEKPTLTAVHISEVQVSEVQDFRQEESPLLESTNSFDKENAVEIVPKMTLMDMYLDGSLTAAYVPSEDELFDYLLGFWDGKSEYIPDAIYHVTIEKENNSTLIMNVEHKDRLLTHTPKDFALNVQEQSLKALDESTEFGEYSYVNEENILKLTNDIDDDGLHIPTLKCKEMKCSLYAEATNAETIARLIELLSTIENANVQFFGPAGSLTEGQIYINYF